MFTCSSLVFQPTCNCSGHNFFTNRQAFCQRLHIINTMLHFVKGAFKSDGSRFNSTKLSTLDQRTCGARSFISGVSNPLLLVADLLVTIARSFLISFLNPSKCIKCEGWKLNNLGGQFQRRQTTQNHWFEYFLLDQW